ncbi:MAG: ankyrin repeat protein [Verrucomicrobiales bacterium]|jgi:ankyrin repeat protein
MESEIENLRKYASDSEKPAEWDWDDLSQTLKKVGGDPTLIPDDLRAYLTGGLFSEPLDLMLSLYSRSELESFITKDEWFTKALAAGYFIIGDRNLDFVCVQLEDLVTFLIPAWSITEGLYTKEKRYKDLRSFLKRMVKDLKESRKWAAEEAEERRLAIESLDASEPNSVDSKGRTRLILAILDSDIETVRAEIARGADPNLAPIKRHPPLHYAVDERSVETIQLLLEAGADPEFGKDEKPLHVAARRGHIELVRTLIEGGAKVDSIRRNSCTPLQDAIPSRDPDLIRYLIDQGADPNLETGSDRSEGRRVFVEAGAYPEMMELLLECEADAKLCTPTFLWNIVNGPRQRQLRMLIDAGADITNLARFANDLETVEMLFEAGAAPDATCNIGRTWIGWVVGTIGSASKKERAENLSMMRVFLENGADPNLSRVDSQEVPLVDASYWEWFEGFQLLLEFGADPKLATENGKTALDFVDEFRPKKNAVKARKLLEEA